MTQNVNVRPGGTHTRTYDATANDSDKTFTVPAGKIWRVTAIFVNYASTATVGNRLVRVLYGDGTNVVFQLNQINSQAASLTYQYAFGINIQYGSTVATNGEYYGPLPDIILPAGWTIRVYDQAAIDAAADDMTVALLYDEFEA